MPSGTDLVSMDFVGRLDRERTVGENFDTTIVSTNLLDTPLRRNSWSFMGSGSIITGGLADKLARARMPFYVERDWIELTAVREALGKHYPAVLD